MRIGRLDLLRYGHFTDRPIALPDADTDFHIVFGPNEAGKSTALSAIGDLLYSILRQSPYNFLHDYDSMCIGAVLQNGASSLEVRRRKGNKDTLLGTDDLPISGGEGALSPFLGGTDRLFFERMFSLDHRRLETGGQEILQAEDDIGQMLFSAGAGISGLRDTMDKLSKEGDGLWARRRADHRKFYRANDVLKAADKAVRDLTVTADKWQDLKREYDKAEVTYVEVDVAQKSATIERSQLSRIRRVIRDVRRNQDLERAIADMSEVALLPKDAYEIQEASARNVSNASMRIETLSGQLKQARRELEGLTYDDFLVRRADEIDYLNERRIEIRRERADLPKREAELAAAEKELQALAAELGWTDDDTAALVDKIPARTQVSVVRTLLTERGEFIADAANRKEALEEAQNDLGTLKERLEEVGELSDASRLAAVVRSVREQGDIIGRVRSAQQNVKDAKGRIDRLLIGMNPAIENHEKLAALQAPPKARVQSHRDLAQDWSRRSSDVQQQVAATENDLARSRKALERVFKESDAVSAEALAGARECRDTLWRLVKIKHIEKRSIPNDDAEMYAAELSNLAGTFEAAMQEADSLADQRFNNADAAARLSEIARTIDEQQEELKAYLEQKSMLSEEVEKLDTQWIGMWEQAPFEPLSSDDMLVWLENRDDVIAAIEAHSNLLNVLEKQQEEESEAKEQLLTVLSEQGLDHSKIENDALPVILESASDEQRTHEAQAQRKTQLIEAVEEHKADVEQHQRALERAKKASADWSEKFTSAVTDLDLAADLRHEAVSAQIDIFDQLRGKAGQFINLRDDRIKKIKQDIDEFEGAVAKFVAENAEDLQDLSGDNAAVTLSDMLAVAVQAQMQQTRVQERLESLEKEIETLNEERRQATTSVKYLMEAAGVGDSEELKEAITRSDELRRLKADLAKTLEALEVDGDGLSVEALETECANIDIDDIAAQETSLDTKLRSLQEQQTLAVEALSAARNQLQAIGGDAAAAQAAAGRQEALSEIREIAERYIRVRTSALLLQWAIDRFRQEKRAPLLKRAGELFSILTDGSFVDLRVQYDNQDKAYLAGLRSSKKVVPVSGMSDGSADQLYLALRAASIEDYLERAQALPFIADDLFINFDNDRAAAGFRVLSKLSSKTQVLFFTHHQHLVDIAQETLGASVHVVSLSGGLDSAL